MYTFRNICRGSFILLDVKPSHNPSKYPCSSIRNHLNGTCFDKWPDLSDVASGSFKKKNPPDIKGTGYVVESLEAALWAFHNSDSFEEGVLKAVNLGDDADTTGAIYGQLAGAYYGLDGIPDRFKDKIVMKELILSYAEGLNDKKGEGIYVKE